MTTVAILTVSCITKIEDPPVILVTVPQLVTTSVTEILYSSAKSGGSINSDGGSPVVVRGACWRVDSAGAQPNRLPTIGDNKTIDGAGEGSFISFITNLTPNTKYHIRAYATNSVGTGYGNSVSLKSGLFDFDGNSYTPVTIGTQVWLKENLRTSKYSNGDAITGWSNYDNASKYDTIYGKLYGFQVIADSRKICPGEYHVASQTDWETLFTFLGGSTVAGGKMKEAGTSHWAAPNVGADNSSGFTALPGGRYDGDVAMTYAAIKYNAIWWSSTDFPGTGNALYYSLINNTTTTFNAGISKNYQMSARCIQD